MMQGLRKYYLDETGIKSIAFQDVAKIKEIAGKNVTEIQKIARQNEANLKKMAAQDVTRIKKTAGLDQNGIKKIAALDYAEIRKIAVLDKTGIKKIAALDEAGIKKIASLDEIGIKNIASIDAAGLKKIASLDEAGIRKIGTLGDAGIKKIAALDAEGIKKIILLDETGIKNIAIQDVAKIQEIAGKNPTEIQKIASQNETDLNKIAAQDQARIKKIAGFDETGINKLSALDDAGIKKIASLDDAGIKKLSSLDYAGIKKIALLDESEIKKITTLDDAGIRKIASLDETGIKKLSVLNETGIKSIAIQDVAKIQEIASKNPTEIQKIASQNESDLKKMATQDVARIKKISGLDQNGIKKISTLDYAEIKKISVLDATGIKKIASLDEAGIKKIASLDDAEIKKIASLNNIEIRKIAGQDASKVQKIAGQNVLEVNKVAALDATEIKKIASLDVTGLKKIAALDDAGIKKIASMGEAGIKKIASLDETGAKKIASQDERGIKLVASLDETGIMKIAYLDVTGIKKIAALDEAGIKKISSLDNAKVKKIALLDEAVIKKIAALDEAGIKKISSLDNVEIKKIASLDETGIKRIATLDDAGIKKIASLDETRIKKLSTLGEKGIKSIAIQDVAKIKEIAGKNVIEIQKIASQNEADLKKMVAQDVTRIKKVASIDEAGIKKVVTRDVSGLKGTANQDISGLNRTAAQGQYGIRKITSQAVFWIRKITGQGGTGIKATAGGDVSGINRITNNNISGLNTIGNNDVSGLKKNATYNISSLINTALQKQVAINKAANYTVSDLTTITSQKQEEITKTAENNISDLKKLSRSVSLSDLIKIASQRQDAISKAANDNILALSIITIQKQDAISKDASDNISALTTIAIQKQNTISKTASNNLSELSINAMGKQDVISKYASNKIPDLMNIAAQKQEAINKAASEKISDLTKIAVQKQEEIKKIANRNIADITRIVAQKQVEINKTGSNNRSDKNKISNNHMVSELIKTGAEKQDAITKIAKNNLSDLTKITMQKQDAISKAASENISVLTEIASQSQEAIIKTAGSDISGLNKLASNNELLRGGAPGYQTRLKAIEQASEQAGFTRGKASGEGNNCFIQSLLQGMHDANGITKRNSDEAKEEAAVWESILRNEAVANGFERNGYLGVGNVDGTPDQKLREQMKMNLDNIILTIYRYNEVTGELEVADIVKGVNAEKIDEAIEISMLYDINHFDPLFPTNTQQDISVSQNENALEIAKTLQEEKKIMNADIKTDKKGLSIEELKILTEKLMVIEKIEITEEISENAKNYFKNGLNIKITNDNSADNDEMSYQMLMKLVSMYNPLGNKTKELFEKMDRLESLKKGKNKSELLDLLDKREILVTNTRFRMLYDISNFYGKYFSQNINNEVHSESKELANQNELKKQISNIAKMENAEKISAEMVSSLNNYIQNGSINEHMIDWITAIENLKVIKYYLMRIAKNFSDGFEYHELNRDDVQKTISQYKELIEKFDILEKLRMKINNEIKICHNKLPQEIDPVEKLKTEVEKLESMENVDELYNSEYWQKFIADGFRIESAAKEYYQKFGVMDEDLNVNWEERIKTLDDILLELELVFINVDNNYKMAFVNAIIERVKEEIINFEYYQEQVDLYNACEKAGFRRAFTKGNNNNCVLESITKAINRANGSDKTDPLKAYEEAAVWQDILRAIATESGIRERDGFTLGSENFLMKQLKVKFEPNKNEAEFIRQLRLNLDKYILIEWEYDKIRKKIYIISEIEGINSNKNSERINVLSDPGHTEPMFPIDGITSGENHLATKTATTEEFKQLWQIDKIKSEKAIAKIKWKFKKVFSVFSRFCGTVDVKNSTRGGNPDLAYSDPARVEAIAAASEQAGFTRGKATGEGNNCFIQSLLQVIYNANGANTGDPAKTAKEFSAWQHILRNLAVENGFKLTEYLGVSDLTFGVPDANLRQDLEANLDNYVLKIWIYNEKENKVTPIDVVKGINAWKNATPVEINMLYDRNHFDPLIEQVNQSIKTVDKSVTVEVTNIDELASLIGKLMDLDHADLSTEIKAKADNYYNKGCLGGTNGNHLDQVIQFYNVFNGQLGATINKIQQQLMENKVLDLLSPADLKRAELLEKLEEKLLVIDNTIERMKYETSIYENAKICADLNRKVSNDEKEFANFDNLNNLISNLAGVEVGKKLPQDLLNGFNDYVQNVNKNKNSENPDVLIKEYNQIKFNLFIIANNFALQFGYYDHKDQRNGLQETLDKNENYREKTRSYRKNEKEIKH